MNAIPMSCWSLLLVLLLLVTVQQHLADAKRVEPTTVDLFRLPSRFEPINYKLEIEMSPEKTNFFGSVVITMNVKEKEKKDSLLSRSFSGYLDNHMQSQRNIILHCEELIFGEIVFRQDDEQQYAQFTFHDKGKKILVITPPRQPKVGSATLSINFSGSVGDEPKGLYWNTLNPKNPVLATHFETSYARRVFPCFDEPEFKATFDVTIVHPERYIALSNMEVDEDSSGYSKKRGYKRTTFKRTPKMPTYLLSMALGKYDSFTRKSPKGFDITIYAPMSAKALTEDIHNAALQAYDAVSDYFSGLDPPIQKIDIVAVDKGNLSMENWGLLTMRWELLSANPRASRPDDWIRAVTILLTQMIHQRLANLVSINWWDDRWLKEGLATSLARKLTAKLNTEQDSKIDNELYALVETTFSAMNDDDQNARSLNGGNPRRTVRQLEESFDLFTYKKSEAIVSMIAGLFDQAIVKTAIHQMIQQSNNVAEPVYADYLWRTLSEAAPEYGSFAIMASLWAKRDGYPIINVEHHLLNGEKGLRVFQLPDPMGSPFWPVPIQYEFNGGPEEERVRQGQIVLHNMELWLPLPEWFNIENEDQWLTLNSKFQGYYRVVYLNRPILEAQFRAILLQRMPAADRMQILSDTYFYAKKRNDMFDFKRLLDSLCRSGERNDGVMLMLTRILTEAYNIGEFPSDYTAQVSQLMIDFYTQDRGMSGEVDSSALKQHARGEVADFLTGKLGRYDALFAT